jgi:hypothetical protein
MLSTECRVGLLMSIFPLFSEQKVLNIRHRYINRRLIFVNGIQRFLIEEGIHADRLCGLVVRVCGYRSIGPGFDFRGYQIF